MADQITGIPKSGFDRLEIRSNKDEQDSHMGSCYKEVIRGKIQHLLLLYSNQIERGEK
jgi:hypothetical protein